MAGMNSDFAGCNTASDCFIIYAHKLTAEKKLHDAFVEGYRQWEQKARQDPEWAKQNPYKFPAVEVLKY